MADHSFASAVRKADLELPLREGHDSPEQASRTLPKILVADDHDATRKSLCKVVAEYGRGEIVGEAVTGKQAVAEARRLRPDLVLLDLSMPELDGLSAAQLIKKTCPEILILIFTVHDGNLFRTLAKNLGLDGFLTKGASTKDLLAAIDEVCHRHKHFPTSPADFS
jgi:DNA-binding NarL/FixJ family response regulator